MAPFHLMAGTIGYALVFGALGFGFGAVLELGGFGDTRKLAAQFYFTDSQSGTFPRRFYRARVLDGPLPPRLRLLPAHFGGVTAR